MRTIVVGAGIVGTSAAFFLQRDGHEVTLLDPRGPGEGTSFGNAGIISLGSVLPVATPGIWREVPGLMRKGALRLRWLDMPVLAPWLARMLRETTGAERFERLAQALYALASRAEQAHDIVIQAAGLTDLVDRVGWLKVGLGKDAVLRATALERAAYERFEVPFEVLDEAGVKALEPALSPAVKAGVFLPRNRAVRHPKDYVAGIAQTFLERGGRHERLKAEAIEPHEAGVIVRTAAGPLAADRVVLAAGAFSGPLTRSLGLRLPLQAERGYHAMLPHPESTLTRPILCLEHDFVLAPMHHGLRLTSGVELARLEAPADDRWVRSLVPLARRYLPSIGREVESTWLGHRPSLPDSLPVIGPVPAARNVILALGHQHVGLTLGPATGRIVADLVAERDPGLDLTPFDPTRYA